LGQAAEKLSYFRALAAVQSVLRLREASTLSNIKLKKPVLASSELSVVVGCELDSPGHDDKRHFYICFFCRRFRQSIENG